MNWDPEAQINMLQLQVEQLQYELQAEIEGHQKANKRAAATERRNRNLKDAIIQMETALAAAAYCWNCASLGDPEICEKCANNTVFVWNGTSYEWRGLPKKKPTANV